MESTLKRTWAEIDLVHLTHNFEVIRRRDAFECDHDGFMKRWAPAEARLRRSIVAARQRLPGIATPEAALRDCAELCVALGSDGLRGELTLLRAGRALASRCPAR